MSSSARLDVLIRVPFLSAETKLNLGTLRHALDLDLAAHDLSKWTYQQRFRNPQLNYQRALRIVEFLLAQRGLLWRILRFYFRFKLHRLSVATGISIPPGVFGPGLSIAHYGSIVVNSGARVGAFCRIHSATNIGVAGGGVPAMGDRVYVAPGAVIYGGITVGDDVAIGANSVVNKDVPSRVSVGGAPARIISQSGSASVMPEWFPAAYGLLERSGAI